MSTQSFKYFTDPDNFSYKEKEASKCSICESEGLWFNAGFRGENQIDCICDSCLAGGALEELEISTNEAYGGTEEETSIIIHKTPALPTWQDIDWPCVGVEYCVFERIASKMDFTDITEFQNSLLDCDSENTEFEKLWAQMPDKTVKNHIEGNYNISVYLFSLSGKKYCVWDSS